MKSTERLYRPINESEEAARYWQKQKRADEEFQAQLRKHHGNREGIATGGDQPAILSGSRSHFNRDGEAMDKRDIS